MSAKKSPEHRRMKMREYRKKWRESEAGRAWYRDYTTSSPVWRECQKRYRSSPKGKEARYKHCQTPVGKEMRRRERITPLAKERQWRRAHSPAGMERSRQSSKRYYDRQKQQ